MPSLALRDDDPTSFGTSTVYSKFREGSEDRTGAGILTFPIPGYARSPKKYPLWKVLVDGVPLPALVSQQGEHWFAEVEWLDLFGEGSSPTEAVDSLLCHVERYARLFSTTSDRDLTAFARQRKERFARLSLVP